MKSETKKTIDFHLSAYRRTGANSYRKKQYNRLLSMIADIFEHSPECQENLTRLGRKQVIGYWERTRDETAKTRLEKYRVLSLLFAKMNKQPPPKPKIHTKL